MGVIYRSGGSYNYRRNRWRSFPGDYLNGAGNGTLEYGICLCRCESRLVDVLCPTCCGDFAGLAIPPRKDYPPFPVWRRPDRRGAYYLQPRTFPVIQNKYLTIT